MLFFLSNEDNLENTEKILSNCENENNHIVSENKIKDIFANILYDYIYEIVDDILSGSEKRKILLGNKYDVTFLNTIKKFNLINTMMIYINANIKNKLDEILDEMLNENIIHNSLHINARSLSLKYSENNITECMDKINKYDISFFCFSTDLEYICENNKIYLLNYLKDYVLSNEGITNRLTCLALKSKNLNVIRWIQDKNLKINIPHYSSINQLTYYICLDSNNKYVYNEYSNYNIDCWENNDMFIVFSHPNKLTADDIYENIYYLQEVIIPIYDKNCKISINNNRFTTNIVIPTDIKYCVNDFYFVEKFNLNKNKLLISLYCYFGNIDILSQIMSKNTSKINKSIFTSDTVVAMCFHYSYENDNTKLLDFLNEYIIKNINENSKYKLNIYTDKIIKYRSDNVLKWLIKYFTFDVDYKTKNYDDLEWCKKYSNNFKTISLNYNISFGSEYYDTVLINSENNLENKTDENKYWNLNFFKWN